MTGGAAQPARARVFDAISPASELAPAQSRAKTDRPGAVCRDVGDHGAAGVKPASVGRERCRLINSVRLSDVPPVLSEVINRNRYESCRGMRIRRPPGGAGRGQTRWMGVRGEAPVGSGRPARRRG